METLKHEIDQVKFASMPEARIHPSDDTLFANGINNAITRIMPKDATPEEKIFLNYFQY